MPLLTTPLLLRGDSEQSRANSYDGLFLRRYNFNTYSTGLGPRRPAKDTRVRLRQPELRALVVHRPATAPPTERERTHLCIRKLLVADGADVAVIDLSSFDGAPC